MTRILGLLLVLAWLAGFGSERVMGQPGEDSWTMPLNLSRSGAASSPSIIVDSNGRLHVIWREGSDGFAYTTGLDTEWQPAVAVELPFGTRQYYPDLREGAATPLFAPTLVAGGGGTIQALWIDELGNLFHSQVRSEDVANFAAWSLRQHLANGVVKAELHSGPDGRLHLSYIQSMNTAEMLAGLYYRQSGDGGATWSAPLALYQSPYFRLLTAETANVEMHTVGATVWVAWDDWAGERVFTIRSRDSGQTWDPMHEVDSRQETDGVDAIGPSRIQLAAIGETVHLAWQAGHEGLDCAQYHQWSADGGESWQPPTPLMETIAGCPQSIQFLRSDQGLFLLATTETESFILAWNGTQWSGPQTQPELAGFLSQETFRWVNYTCGRDVVTQASHVFVASCGGTPGQDIWLISRSLDQLAAAVAVTPVWSTPVSIHQGENPDFAPVLVADGAGRFHALWSQVAPMTTGSPATAGKVIYYAAWESGRWSRPVVVPTSPEGDAEGLAAAIDSGGRLLAVWSDRRTGAIYFSRVEAARAIMASEWSEPQPLPIPRPAASAPDIAVDPAGIIYVAYAIPVNEGRGTYLVISSDGGASWSEPIMAFDAATAGWEIVDRPQLAPASEGRVYLLWRRRALPVDSNATTLYYARSEDWGNSWSEPAKVEEGSQGITSVVWSQIAAIGEVVVHRAWQAGDGGQLVLWHQQSLDGGNTWSQTSRVAGADTAAGSPALVKDGAGQVHLLQAVGDRESHSRAVLQIWTWQDGRWLPGEGLELGENMTGYSGALAAAIGPDGQLATLYSSRATPDQPVQLVFSGRFLPLPSVAPTPPPTPTPTPAATVTPTPTPLPQPTATRSFAADSASRSLPPVLGPVGGSSGLVAGLTFAVIPVGFALLLVWYRSHGGEAITGKIAQKLDRWYVSGWRWLSRPAGAGQATQSPAVPDWFALLNLAGAALAGVLWYRFPQLGPWPLLVAAVPWFLRQSTWSLRATPLDPLLGIFVLAAGVGVWATYDWAGGWAKFWLIVAAVLIFYALAHQPPANLWPLAALLGTGGALIAVYFILTHDWNVMPAGIGIVDRLAQRWMAVRPPLGTSVIHPNQVAGVMALLAPFLAAVGLRAWHAGQQRLVGLAVACSWVLLIGLLLTGSRGALLGLNIALGTCLLWYLCGEVSVAFNLPRRVVFAAAFVIICGLILVILLRYPGGPLGLAGQLPGAPSADSRLALYEHTLALIRDFRFTGGGLAAFPGLYGHYILGIPTDFFFYSHNLFLGVLLEQGPPGLLALVGLLIGSGWLLLQPRAGVATTPNLSLLRWTMVSSLLIVVIHGLVDDPLYGHRGTPLLFLIPGLAVAFNQAALGPFQWSWPTRRQAIATVVGVVTLVLLLLAALLGPLQADWKANLGAVTMARIELSEWPSNRWDTGLNVAALEPAERLFNEALAADPGQPTAHHRLGLIAMLRRDYATAVAHLEAARRADPGHPGIRKALGYSYTWAGRLDEAEVLLASVPEAARELEIYAWWWLEQDRVDLAERATQMLARLQAAPATGN